MDQTLQLLDAHLGAEEGARWMRLLTAYTNGFLLTEPDLADRPDPSEVALVHPRVMAAAEQGARSGAVDFELGLDVLVSAMRAGAGR